jgi:SAM-dependent methyltransferase
MQKQVNSIHYEFKKYVHKRRWASIWHQLDEVIKLHPSRVLEIGPGPGLFKGAATALGLNVETLDIDPDLKPDHLASVFQMPFDDGDYNVVCAFQMLEHLPYDQSLTAFAEMCRVAKSHVVISLPDASRGWPQIITLPKLGMIRFTIPRPILIKPEHKFDGEHYWEINKVGYPLKKIVSNFVDAGNMKLVKTYRVTENTYHRFFIFESNSVIND